VEPWTLVAMAAELARATADDKGTVEHLFAGCPEEVRRNLTFTARGLQALPLTPPQQAWLGYLQLKRDAPTELQVVATQHLSLAEIFTAAANLKAAWLTREWGDFEYIPMAAPTISYGSAALASVTDSWLRRGEITAACHDEYVVLTNVERSIKLSRTDIVFGDSNGAFAVRRPYGYGDLPDALLASFRAVLDGYLEVRAQDPEIAALRREAEQAGHSLARQLCDTIDQITQQRSQIREWVGKLKTGVGRTEQAAINSLASLVATGASQ
jgi:hypothetical protein